MHNPLYRLIQSGLLALLVLLPVQAHSEQNPVDTWLDKMSQASRLQNYRGTLIIRQQDKLQTIRVNQGITEEGSWQTLQSLNGEPQHIYRHNDMVTSIFPAKKLVTIAGESDQAPLHPMLPKNRRILKKYYSLSLGGEDRIADKPAQIIQVKPLDELRYGYTFWIDRDSGILLKCDMLSEEGKVLEQLMYSEVELLDQQPEQPLDLSVLKKYRTINLREEGAQASSGWKATRLPDGFILKRSVRLQHVKDNLIHHMVYSDGVASVSVFVEKVPVANPVLGASTMGPVNAFSSRINDQYVTAIGEVPLSTVRMIAQSMQRAK